MLCRQLSALPPSDLSPTVEELMVGEQLKMRIMRWPLAFDRSADTTGAKAADSADHVCEAIQMGLRAIEHTAALPSTFTRTLSWPGTTRPLPVYPLMVTPRRSCGPCPWVMRSCLGASWTRLLRKLRSEVVANESRRCPLRCLRRRPRRLQLLLLLTPSRPPASARASRRRARVADMARRLQASPSRLRIRKLNLRASLTSQRRRVLAVVGIGVDAVHHSPSEKHVSSPLPQVGPRLLQFYCEWALVTENGFVLEVIHVGASLVFPTQPPLSDSCVPFSLHHEGNPKRDALMAKGW